MERPKYWKQCGIKAAIGTQMLSEICPDCQGTGLAVDPAHDPDCICQGTGERPVMDCMDGSYDGTEDCSCRAPIARPNVVERVYLGGKVA